MIGALGFLLILAGIVLIATTLTGTTGQVLFALIGGGGATPGATTATHTTGVGVNA